MARIRWQHQIAGPQSIAKPPVAVLVALNMVSDVLGPGRLHNVREVLFDIAWGANTSAGEITIEGAADPDYAGTWAPLAVIAWTAGGKTDQWRFTGSQMALRARVSTLVVGSDGVTVTAQGNQ